MVMLETLKRYLGNGWVEADETWTYVSTDDPTGVFKVNADVTGKYSPAMRIKMTNGGNTIHGIITKVGTYGGDQSGYTYITFLHEIDPTDNSALYLMANSAISNPYYSSVKCPYGFPMNPDKWRVRVTDSNLRSQSSPVSGTWYNIGSPSISIPIGLWNVSYSVSAIMGASSASDLGLYTTLSTSNNSASDNDFTTRSYVGNVLYLSTTFTREKVLLLGSKTIYYLNTRGIHPNINLLRNDNHESPLILTATCAYL